jgi:hypothetical protein
MFFEIQGFQTISEELTETKIKCLRTGCGEVYTNNTFQTFLKITGSLGMEFFHRKTE